MVKHKDIIILVTFSDAIRNHDRFERYAFQSADCAFIKSVNPYGYKFADMDEVYAFLDENKRLIQANCDSDHWSYFKHFVLGDEYDKPGEQKIYIWKKGHDLNIPYKDIVIESVVTYNKATGEEIDITKKFAEVWNIGHNPPKRIRDREFYAMVECTVRIPKVWLRAREDLNKEELKKIALHRFMNIKIEEDISDIIWGEPKCIEVKSKKEDN